jgi:hypothetical protein
MESGLKNIFVSQLEEFEKYGRINKTNRYEHPERSTANESSSHVSPISCKLSTTATSNDLSYYYRSLSINHHLLFGAVCIPETSRQVIDNGNKTQTQQYTDKIDSLICVDVD